ncbi:RHS repeat-associated protein [Chryseobacterium sp. SLBN-27]|uniref:RHS repeat-associated core domain-containing protein n=1 Tax=Chryseobacterium sp. SLBN-27 TaxID=3042287 RepID=UPI00285C84F9|nr:RHS repeat-associated core domain-containing protein [Chryseobacterium sp. SLBN-27]MDR6157127.1 RHS repeat-associated protein [Chryseobacterium sp. SLBN-27]
MGGTALGSGLQTVDYQYNIRGWMTQINDPNNLGGDLFGYKIKYNEVEGLQTPDTSDPSLQVLPKYNGNIAEVDWKTGVSANESLKRYGYVYDKLNRLSAGFYQNSTNPSLREYYEKATYDLNGNIKTIKRTAQRMGATALLIDNLTYQYENSNASNRLQKVSDAVTLTQGFPYKATPTNIGYDDNGNMTSFPDKNISSIQYNYLNLPKKITQNSQVTDYLYRADGVKVKKLFGGLQTDYLDGFQYKFTYAWEDETGTMTSDGMKLRIIPTAEGYFDGLRNRYFYNYTDHLGNVRLSYSDADGNGQVTGDIVVNNCYDTPDGQVCNNYIITGEAEGITNYYPFGLMHNAQSYSFDNAYNYKYNGKELQETGMYDYGARFYMPDIGRWGVVDPLAETSRRWNPYNYGYNNPIRFVDPDGRQAEDKIKIFNNGKIERTKDNNPYDTVTNEDESKSIKIARTNVTEDNPTGDSQIGEAKTVPYEIEGEYGEPSSSEYTYLQINNDAVADSFFEFAADNTKKEFGQDRLSFTDGFTTNIIGTNHSDTTSSSAVDAIGYKEVNTNFSGKHFINQATREERVHNHRAGIGAWGPSGFDVSRNSKTGELLIQKTFLNPVGDRKSYNPSVRNTYQYTPGVGYFKYNKDTATYIGKTKK